MDAHSAGKLPHGLLITGPKGIGKATLAYRFAKHLLSASEDEQSVHRRIIAGSHADLLVVEQTLDPKKGEVSKDISVDQAREVAEFLSLTPGEGTWRVVIIDSVDALNVNGANAVLKILEEPPPQAVLILISHNPGKLLPTIRSRCSQIKLAPLNETEFEQVVSHVAPDVEGRERQSLQLLSGGAPGVALDLKDKEALDMYAQIIELCADMPEIDALKLHSFAAKIGSGKTHENWQLFTRLMLCLHERTTKTALGNNLPEIVADEADVLEHLATIHASGVWAAKWQQCADQFLLASSRHLDYKQIVITYIHSIANTEGFQLGNTAA